MASCAQVTAFWLRSSADVFVSPDSGVINAILASASSPAPGGNLLQSRTSPSSHLVKHWPVRHPPLRASPLAPGNAVIILILTLFWCLSTQWVSLSLSDLGVYNDLFVCFSLRAVIEGTLFMSVTYLRKRPRSECTPMTPNEQTWAVDTCAIWVMQVCSCDLGQRSSECENRKAVLRVHGQSTGRGMRVALVHVCDHWTCDFIDSHLISEDLDVLFLKYLCIYISYIVKG